MTAFSTNCLRLDILHSLGARGYLRTNGQTRRVGDRTTQLGHKSQKGKTCIRSKAGKRTLINGLWQIQQLGAGGSPLSDIPRGSRQPLGPGIKWKLICTKEYWLKDLAVKGEEWEVREERTRGGGKRERERNRKRSEGQTRYFLGSKCNLSTRSLADRCEHFTVREYDFKRWLKKVIKVCKEHKI